MREGWMERWMMEADRMWMVFLFCLFFLWVGERGQGAGQRKMVKEDECETGSQEVDDWVEVGEESVMMKRPADLSLTPPSVSVSLSLSVLVSREDEFSGRLSSRAGFRGCSALHYATLADDPHLVRTLLEAGRCLTPPP